MYLLPVPSIFWHHPALRNLSEAGLKDDLPLFHAVWTT